MERVAQDHVVAEGGDLGRQEALDGRLRRQRDEGRRADLAVGGAQDAGAGAGAGVAGGDLRAGTRLPASIFVIYLNIISYLSVTL